MNGGGGGMRLRALIAAPLSFKKKQRYTPNILSYYDLVSIVVRICN